MSRKIFDSHQPELLENAHTVDFLPLVERRSRSDMQALWGWIDYFKGRNIPFEVRRHPFRTDAVQLWKLERVAYDG